MINLIGTMPVRDSVLKLPETHWHDYGKEPRPGRKLGHITLLASTVTQRDALARKLLREIDPATSRNL
jgi:5-(carboxyamino)imidazole ribonucleotide synthase